MKKKFRLLNKIYAKLGHYFWLPCPICGEMFGGHEDRGHLMITDNSGQSVCSDCIEKAKQININRFIKVKPKHH